MTEHDESIKQKFFVYIIESPSAPDIYHGRSEGSLLTRAVELDRTPSVTRTVINREAFGAALTIGLPGVMKAHPALLPIIHISAHGASHGIQLSSGEEITWRELRQYLVPINESFGGVLLLCMSACEGYSACRMAMHEEDSPHPFFAMVGNFGKPAWSDTAVAYASFYHLLSKGRSVPEAVDGMNAACGDNQWAVTTAEKSRRGYLEYLANVPSEEAIADLEVVAEEAPNSETAKALERADG